MTTFDERGERSGLGSRVATGLKESVLLKIATFGFLQILLAVGIEGAIRMEVFGRGIWGTWAVIFLLWGVALVVAGFAGRAVIWWRRY